MKVVIDEKIPYLESALEELGFDVVAKPGAGINHDDVVDATALFVRTRTKCDKSLLYGSSVRFIGTATIGYDHIDREFCRRTGITWKNAAGCNAGAVLQYVQSVIYSWTSSPSGLALGIVGVGEIGSRVASWAETAGMKVYRNDPPKALACSKNYVSLEEIAEKCDIITLHTTLEKDGEFPTYHLADEVFFNSLKRCKLLINASRGEVVDNEALLIAIKCGKIKSVALDVWENEPEIDKELLSKAFVATPHIAGYSAEGKLNATSLVLHAFLDYIAYNGARPKFSLPMPENNTVVAGSECEALLSIYSPLEDSENLKAAPADFENLRNNYTLRREPIAYNIELKK